MYWTFPSVMAGLDPRLSGLNSASYERHLLEVVEGFGVVIRGQQLIE
jgi:hypothetical protein